MMPYSSPPKVLMWNSWDTAPTPSVPNRSVPQLTIAASATHQNTEVVVAQFDQDILGDITSGFRNFYESGQIWALIVGVIIGYVIRGITTYK